MNASRLILLSFEEDQLCSISVSHQKICVVNVSPVNSLAVISKKTPSFTQSRLNSVLVTQIHHFASDL